ncbi:MAG: anaerobic glycerol-3-phosphate dehydrogenase subunit C [Bacillota bacterium]
MREQQKDTIDLCLKCSTCNTVCPVYAVNPLYPGPKFLGPEMARLRDLRGAEVEMADYCIGCRQCQLACPNGVEIVSLIEETKVKGRRDKGIPFRDRILGHNQIVSRLASCIPGLVNLTLSSSSIRGLVEKIFGIKNRPFPTYQKAFSYKPDFSQSKKSKLKVAYFTGCYSRYNSPAIAQSVVNILKKCGVEVVVPPQKCCGVPLVSNGLTDEAKKNAEFNLEVLSKLVDQGYLIVASCPSCTLSLKQDYKLYGFSHGNKVASQVNDICEFLLDYQLVDVGQFLPLKRRYYYHQPCHTKAQGMGTPAVKLLELIPELIMVQGEQKCCGQAGTYGFKKEKFKISAAIGEKLFQDVTGSNADGIVTDCGMCSLQLTGGTGQKVFHPIELLAGSYRSSKNQDV